MAKVSPQSITSTYNAVGKLNANFEEIAEALENTLSRDGTGPNQMEADLDMNGFAILNSNLPVGPTGPQGLSAYQLAVAQGYSGSLQDWLASLVAGGITGIVTYSDKNSLAAASTVMNSTAFLGDGVETGIFKWSSQNHWNGRVAFDTKTDLTVTALTEDPGMYSITKTGGTDGVYDTFIAGTTTFSGNFELWGQASTSGAGSLGVDTVATGHSWNTLDYSFGLGEGVLYAYTNGTAPPGGAGTAPLDSALNWFCLRRLDGVITLWENTTKTLEGATLRFTFSGSDNNETLYPVFVPYYRNRSVKVQALDTDNVGTGMVQGDPLRAVYVPPLTDTSGKSGAWVRQTHFITPEMFGAVGDGVTNDHAAIQAAGDFLNTQGYGWLRFTHGKTYRVGKQNVDTSATTPYYNSERIISIKSPSGRIWIEGNGAKLLAIDGLRYGGFHPTTGVSDSSQAGDLTPDLNYLASPYAGMIQIEGWHDNPDVSLRIEHITLDGNIENTIIGGGWGDSGAQVLNAGLQLLGAGRHEIIGVRSFSHGTDGATLESTTTGKSLSEYKFGYWTDCEMHFNGRQGLSVIGGRGITWERCSFSHTCRLQSNPLAAGPVISNPKYGVDLEPDGGNAVGGLRFIQCYFLNNAGGGLGADSGQNYDVVVRDSFFSGDLNFTHTVAFNSEDDTANKPGFLFENNRFYGIGVDKSRRQLDGQLQEGPASIYRNNIWSDDPAYSYSGTLYTSGGSNFTGDVLFEGDIFNHMNNTDLPSIPSNVNVIMRNCLFRSDKAGTHQTAPFFEGRTIVEGAGVELAAKDAPERVRGIMIVNNVEQFVGTKTHDFGVLEAGAEAATTFTVPGARSTDGRNYDVLGLPGTLNLLRAYVSANDTVTVRVSAATGGATASSNALTVVGISR